MRIFSQKKIFLPALTIIGVVILLLILIGFSTFRNLDRQKFNALESLHRQGIILLKALEAGAKYGMVVDSGGRDSIQTLIQEMGRDDGVAHIYLFASQGRITHHNDPDQIGHSASWTPRFNDPLQVKKRITELSRGEKIYEIAKRFTPVEPDTDLVVDDGKKAVDHHSHADEVVVVGLRMTLYSEARRADIHHAVIMAAILIVLGSGAIFFLFVIQNYYLVDKTLKQTQDYTRQLIASMGNGLLSIDLDSRVVSMNPTAQTLLGMTEAQAKKFALQDLNGFERLAIHEVLDACHTISEKEIGFSRLDGRNLSIGVSAAPIILEDGRCGGAVLELRDLEEIKKLEEQVRRAEKLAAVGRLAAGVAHEIRNPLSSIKGFAQFLRHGLKERPKDREYADIMVREIDRINRVINDLLAFAKPMTPQCEPTDAGELVIHVIRMIETEALTRGIVIKRELGNNLDGIALDAGQIIQALLNLALNALKSVQTGGKIRFVAAVDKAKDQFVFQVEDDGPGIPPQNMEKIFDPFFTTREEGTGLGLAIVEKIVEGHHGKIFMESPVPGEGQGCRATVKIPLN